MDIIISDWNISCNDPMRSFHAIKMRENGKRTVRQDGPNANVFDSRWTKTLVHDLTLFGEHVQPYFLHRLTGILCAGACVPEAQELFIAIRKCGFVHRLTRPKRDLRCILAVLLHNPHAKFLSR